MAPPFSMTVAATANAVAHAVRRGSRLEGRGEGSDAAEASERGVLTSSCSARRTSSARRMGCHCRTASTPSRAFMPTAAPAARTISSGIRIVSDMR